MDTEERFWIKVDRTGDCWIWTAGRTSAGYGAFHPVRTRLELAHRWAYKLVHGDIPPGLHIDHECHNRDKKCTGGRKCPHRLCVNPGHLVAKEPADNYRASPNANQRKTHCPRLHEYSPENTIYQVRKNTISRKCRECARLRDRSPKRLAQQRIRRARSKEK